MRENIDTRIRDPADQPRVVDDLGEEVVSIRGDEWQEVDFPEDVEAAKALTARWASSP